jgi:hypothetical protein
MSVTVVFPNGTDWFKANWVFHQLAEDVSNRYRHDDRVCKSLELAQAFGSLNLKDMDENLRRDVMQAIRTVAEETVRGTIEGWTRGLKRRPLRLCGGSSPV